MRGIDELPTLLRETFILHFHKEFSQVWGCVAKRFRFSEDANLILSSGFNITMIWMFVGNDLSLTDNTFTVLFRVGDF